jgi:hypothetical protein
MECQPDYIILVASIKGHVQVFQALLEHGAGMEASSQDGFTPLLLACAFRHLVIIIEFLVRGVGLDANNDSEGATSILGKRKSRGANIEAKDISGDTPLHFASFKGHVTVEKALLNG